MFARIIIKFDQEHLSKQEYLSDLTVLISIDTFFFDTTIHF